ncbi:MAG: cation:proton antiporter [Gemmatimonadota bacterium]
MPAPGRMPLPPLFVLAVMTRGRYDFARRLGNFSSCHQQAQPMAPPLLSPTSRTVGRLFTLLIIALLATFLRFFGPPAGMKADTMLLGFLLLAAFVAGDLARELRLPRITGYLLIGILLGPSVLGLLPEQTVVNFEIINGTALSVIALQAGSELRLAGLRERFAGIGAITASQIVITLVGIVATVYVAQGLFPLLSGQSNRTILAIALIFGIVAVANSPATTVAVITEMKARGQLADTVLGVSVLKDVILLLLIAVMVPAAAVLVDPAHGFDFAELRDISTQILAALALGSVVGGSIGLYLLKVDRRPILFVLAIAFIIVELSRALGFQSELYILMGMAAGFVVQNLTDQGSKLVDALEANALPVYALFFAVAGGALDLSVIPQVWQAGLVIILARAALIYLSTGLGARLARETETIRRFAWQGFLAQAGVTLALAIIVRDRFPVWGPQVAAIIIAMIAVNQLIGPPLFRLALVRAGETRLGSAR